MLELLSDFFFREALSMARRPVPCPCVSPNTKKFSSLASLGTYGKVGMSGKRRAASGMASDFRAGALDIFRAALPETTRREPATYALFSRSAVQGERASDK